MRTIRTIRDLSITLASVAAILWLAPAIIATYA